MDTFSGIRQTLGRYAFGMDEGDFDFLAGCFTQDASVQFPGGRRVEGRSNLLAEYRRRNANRSGQVRMYITDTVVLSEAEFEADAVSYVLAIDHGQDGIRVASTGWYRDTFMLEDDVWRINRRIVHRDGTDAPVSPLAAWE